MFETQKVDPAYLWKYRLLRFFLYLFFAVLAVVFVMKLVYPNEKFYFLFRVYRGAGNTIADPRYSDEKPIEKGAIKASQPIFFNVSTFGNFEKIFLGLKLENSSNKIESGEISVTRSYRAFLLPEGPSAGFRDGSLLKNGSEYFLVSDQKVRKFSSPKIFEDMGFPENAFLEAEDAELSVHEKGADIADSREIPEGSLFNIEENYYQFKGQKFHSFVSERAYLTSHREQEASLRDPSFLKRFSLEDKMIGFSNGTLLSFGESAYAVENDFLRPIASVQVFLQKGYSWEDIISATGEEFGLYQRGKLYTIFSPHPDGTVFFCQDEDMHYLIEEGNKKEIAGKNILEQYLSARPIMAECDNISESCQIGKPDWLGNYSCEIPLEKIKDSPGAEYAFTLKAKPDIQLQDMEIEFFRSNDKKNMDLFLSDLKDKLKSKYNFLK